MKHLLNNLSEVEIRSLVDIQGSIITEETVEITI